MVFLVVMFGCESWTVKKAEGQRIDALELWCWRRLLKVPWDSKEVKPGSFKEDQPWIFSGWTDAEAEAPVFWSSDADRRCGKVTDAGKDWGQEKRASEDEIGWHHWCKEHGLGQTLGDVRDREAWRAAVHGFEKSWTRLGDWRTTKQQTQVEGTRWVLKSTMTAAAVTVAEIQAVESHADTHDSLTAHLCSQSLERGPSSCRTRSVKDDSWKNLALWIFFRHDYKKQPSILKWR